MKDKRHDPGERHWDILRGLMGDGQAAGLLVMDAVLAAIALEHGAALCTTDRDFAVSQTQMDEPACGRGVTAGLARHQDFRAVELGSRRPVSKADREGLAENLTFVRAQPLR